MTKKCTDCTFYQGNPYIVSIADGKGKCEKFEKRLSPIVPLDEAQYCAYFTTHDGKGLTSKETMERPKRNNN